MAHDGGYQPHATEHDTSKLTRPGGGSAVERLTTNSEAYQRGFTEGWSKAMADFGQRLLALELGRPVTITLGFQCEHCGKINHPFAATTTAPPDTSPDSTPPSS